MIYEMDVVDWATVFSPMLSSMFVIVLIALMLIAYVRFRIFLVILTIFLFSLVIGMESITVNDMPFTPFIQIFFMLFQTIFFILTVFKTFLGDVR